MDIKTKFKELKAKVKKEYKENKLFYNIMGVLVAADSVLILTEVAKKKGYEAGLIDGHAYALNWMGDKCGIKTEVGKTYQMRIYPEIPGSGYIGFDWLGKEVVEKMAADGVIDLAEPGSNGTLAEVLVSITELKK